MDSESPPAVPRGRSRHDEMGPPVLTTTWHDVFVSETSTPWDNATFCRLMFTFMGEIHAATSSQEILLIVRKVVRMWEGFDPPGRFLERPKAEATAGAQGWVVASKRTSDREIIDNFGVLRKNFQHTEDFLSNRRVVEV
jgi:hypothetical protein